HVRERHRVRIGWIARLPPRWLRQPPLVNLEQHEVGPATRDRVGGQVHLLRRGEVDETLGPQRLRLVDAGAERGLPVGARAEVHDRHADRYTSGAAHTTKALTLT